MSTPGHAAIATLIADYRNPAHAEAVVSLLDSYARDPAGGGTPLDAAVREALPAALAARPQAFSVLAYDGERAVGLINCIEGFSTFACKPLVNVHDVVVRPSHRGLPRLTGGTLSQRTLRRKGISALLAEMSRLVIHGA